MPTLRLAPLPALLGAFLCFVAPAHAATLNVPTTAYPTIQAAVSAAQSGDTVLIADGTYSGDGNRDIDFGGKNLTITSQHGPANTIIDCGGTNTTDGSGNHRAFYFHSSETAAVVSGLTIKNGYESNVSGVADSGGGGGICIDGSSVSIKNCTFSSNTAWTLGGGIAIDNLVNGPNITTLTDCTVVGNTAQVGGGISSGNGDNITGTIALTDCIVSGNNAQYGGGISDSNAGGSSKITLTHCTIFNNVAALYGGGVENDNGLNSAGTISLSLCTVYGNTATENGGGIHNNNRGFGSGNNGTITLMNCTVTGNTTGESGGGISNANDKTNGTIALSGCIVSGNTAQNGGGIQSDNNGDATSNGTITLTNCVISGNTASGACGGLINGNENYSGNLGGMIALTNCTVTSNAAQSGGGVYDYNNGGIITLTDDLVYGDMGGEIFNYYGTPVITFSDIQGGYPGSGNINADPLFVYAAGGNLHLKPVSPCLGAGTSAGAPTTDLDGHTRPNPPSIGAYEATPSHTHLLWTNTSGAAAIWTINPDGSVTSTPGYGPIPGWTAKTIADGPDGKTRLLWRRTDGRCAVWTISTADGTITSTPGYAPQGGWITVGLAVGPDNLTRLQWEIDPAKRVGLGNAVWTLDGAGNVTSTPPYRPDGFWTATALAVGGDGLSRLLWVNGGVPSGQYPFAVWTLNTAGVIASTPLYQPQPYAAWTATTIAGGPDTNTRLLLNRTDGAMAVWTVDVPGDVASTPLYGPIPSWACHGLAVGPDALSRVLWSRTDGMSAVWTIAADGSIASTPGYGPIPGWSAVALSVGP